VERLVGNVGFLLLYTVSGLVGSTARLYWDLDIISAGASGAVFGVWGALLGFLIWRRDSVPAEVLVSLRNSGVSFLGYNLVFGLFVQGIDHAAHLGGLAAGILCGLTLSQPLTGEARLGRPFRNALVAVGGILVLASALLLLPKGKSSFAAVMIRFEETEKKVLNSYNDAIDRARAGQLTDEDFAKLLEREILPDWRSLRGDLDQLQNVKADRVRMLAQLKDYAKLREEHWAAFLDALRDPDPAKLAEARRKGEVVDEALKQLGAAVK
jgi:rhomboid protease GluP